MESTSLLAIVPLKFMSARIRAIGCICGRLFDPVAMCRAYHRTRAVLSPFGIGVPAHSEIFRRRHDDFIDLELRNMALIQFFVGFSADV